MTEKIQQGNILLFTKSGLTSPSFSTSFVNIELVTSHVVDAIFSNVEIKIRKILLSHLTQCQTRNRTVWGKSVKNIWI